MQQLYPRKVALGLDEIYDDLVLAGDPSDPQISLGMVSSIDGASAIGGLTADLGGAADGVAFRRLRDAADAILVGAGTVRDEQYKAPDPSPERRARRRAQGLAEVPTLIIVTRSLDLESNAPVFRGEVAPVLLTTAQAAARRTDLQGHAEIVVLGEDDVALDRIGTVLAPRGFGRTLCEGGPQLNAALLGAGRIDELFLTVAPVLVGGDVRRIVMNGDAEVLTSFTLVSLYEHDGELLLRYRRR